MATAFAMATIRDHSTPDPGGPRFGYWLRGRSARSCDIVSLGIKGKAAVRKVSGSEIRAS
jgi:hypothetical protein